MNDPRAGRFIINLQLSILASSELLSLISVLTGRKLQLSAGEKDHGTGMPRTDSISEHSKWVLENEDCMDTRILLSAKWLQQQNIGASQGETGHPGTVNLNKE